STTDGTQNDRGARKVHANVTERHRRTVTEAKHDCRRNAKKRPIARVAGAGGPTLASRRVDRGTSLQLDGFERRGPGRVAARRDPGAQEGGGHHGEGGGPHRAADRPALGAKEGGGARAAPPLR